MEPKKSMGTSDAQIISKGERSRKERKGNKSSHALHSPVFLRHQEEIFSIFGAILYVHFSGKNMIGGAFLQVHFDCFILWWLVFDTLFL